MIEVVEKTRELGEAIVASKEYREMQLAEALPLAHFTGPT